MLYPALPGCVTYGKDVEEAKKMAIEAIALYLESLEEHNELIDFCPQEKFQFRPGSLNLFCYNQPMNECFFCIVQKQSNRIAWESSFLFAVYDNYPVNPGHTLLIPKRHAVDICDLDKGEWEHISGALREIIPMNEKKDFIPIYQQFIKDKASDESVWFCKKALANPKINTKPDAYNHGINDGKAAGRTINHLHWHIIPRFDGDMDDPRGGVRFVIPELGNYKIPRT